MNEPIYLAHAGEESLFVLVPLLIIVILIVISSRRGGPPDVDDE